MSWYSPLSKSSLADLIADPRKELTAGEVVQLAQDDVAVVSDAFWGDAAPEAYRLTPDIVAKLVQSRGSRDEWWFKISADIRDALTGHGGQNVPPAVSCRRSRSGPVLPRRTDILRPKPRHSAVQRGHLHSGVHRTPSTPHRSTRQPHLDTRPDLLRARELLRTCLRRPVHGRRGRNT